MNEYFVITSPGIEEYTHTELLELGIQSTIEYGGLTFKGDALDMYKANYFLRTANRIIARIGQPFYTRSFEELSERMQKLPWEKHFDLRFDFDFQVSCSHSKLMHTGVVSKLAAQAIEHKLSKAHRPTKLDKSIKQLVNIRIENDKLTASIDTSGEILYKRGYRQEITRSPIRETLAAALIMASGWDREAPLIDPFCGSGTIPLEASLMAFNIPAGYHRNFAFTNWLDFESKTWKNVKESSQIDFEKKVDIVGYDRDAGAIVISRSNAHRAGVAERVTFECQALSYLTHNSKHGWIVTNPPYGHRISEGNDLRNLYAQLGKVLSAEVPGWNLAIVTNDIKLSGHSGFKFAQVNQVSNGGIKTVFEKCVIPK